MLISVVSILGVETTSFLAILGAAGLAIGLALQGSLSNFAGGVLIILFRPYSVGDYVKIDGYNGTVRQIQVFNTFLTTVDNTTIIIPNGTAANTTINNYSTEKNRRVDITFGVGYEQDIQKVREILQKISDENPLIHKDPEPFVAVAKHGESAVDIALKVWTDNAHYWSVFYYMQEQVKLAFDKEQVSIPYPQRDVHIIDKKQQ